MATVSMMTMELPGAPGRRGQPVEPGDFQALGLDELADNEEAARAVARLTRTAVQGGSAPVRTAAFNAYI